VGGLIPLSDASRRLVHFPIVTTCIILTNFFVFALELRGGDAFVLRWAAVAANITAGHDWITILTAMFLHGSGTVAPPVSRVQPKSYALAA
jgi:membrane associated rhomboid family serine protease